MVTETLPQDGAFDVPTNTSVAVIFDIPMRPVDASHFSLSTGENAIAGTVTMSPDGRSSTFVTLAELAPLEVFEGAIRAGALSLQGVALEADHRWSFTTGEQSDLTRPQVASTSPARGSNGAATNQRISVTFTEAMDPATIGVDTFTVLTGGTPVAGNVVYSGVTALFSPTHELEPDTAYSAEIAADVADLAGSPLQTAFRWPFATGEPADWLAPTVVSSTPGASATGVPVNQRVSVTFSEPMDPTSMNGVTFTLRQGATPIAATVTHSGLSAFLTPWEALEHYAEYTATLSTAAMDLAGNPLATAHEWRFTTSDQPDLTSPTAAETAYLKAGLARWLRPPPPPALRWLPFARSPVPRPRRLGAPPGGPPS